MAIQGMPTLQDIDWQGVAQHKEQMKLKREQEWLQEFEAQMRAHATSVNPRLTWDGSNLKFSAPTTKQYGDAELWNMYINAAKSRGFKPDVKYFDQQLKPYYKQLADEAFKKQLGALRIQNVPTKAFHRLFKDDPVYKDFFTHNMQGETDETAIQMLSALTPAEEGEGLWKKVTDNPFQAGVGGAIAVGASKALYDKAKAMAEKSKKGRGGALSRGMRAWGPAAASFAVSPLARQLGATEREADIMQGVANVGVGGYYGRRGFQTSRRNMLRQSLGGKHLTTKELTKHAKDLGIKKGDLKKTKSALQKQIKTKVKSLGYKGTVNKIGKTGFSGAWKRFLAKAGAKQVAGSALPGWGNLAMAALTVSDVIALGQELFGGTEESSTLHNPYAPGSTVTNQQVVPRSW